MVVDTAVAVPFGRGALTGLVKALGVEDGTLRLGDGDGEAVGFFELEKKVKELSLSGRSVVIQVQSVSGSGVEPLSLDAIGGAVTIRAVRWDAIQSKFLLTAWQMELYRSFEDLTVQEAQRLLIERRTTEARRRGIFRRRS